MFGIWYVVEGLVYIYIFAVWILDMVWMDKNTKIDGQKETIFVKTNTIRKKQKKLAMKVIPEGDSIQKYSFTIHHTHMYTT